MTSIRNKALAAVLTAAALAIGAGGALAGDPMADAHGYYLKKKHFTGFDCDSLWYFRNQIFSEAGYCFKTDRAIATFGNDGCVSGSYSILNKYERANVNMLRSIEAAKSCRS